MLPATSDQSVAIVIPFFQRTPGALRRAVNSILAQRGNIAFKIYIVDDSSPIDPQIELGSLSALLGDRLTILKQPNGGPSSARNRGLDFIRNHATAVAFLDSDDEWGPEHLLRVCDAMEAGADFFFSDYRRPDAPKTRFNQDGLADSAHRSVEGKPGLWWFESDFFDLLLKGSPVGTSTVAYRLEKLSELRFRSDLWLNEDVLFWMEVSRRTDKVAFTTRSIVNYGAGVNISLATWGTVQRMKRTLHAARFHSVVAANFSLSSEQKHWNDAFRVGLDDEFIRSAIAAALRREPGWLDVARKYLGIRPTCLSRLPVALLGILNARVGTRKELGKFRA